MTGGALSSREKGKRGCSRGTEGLYTLGEALGRGKEELDAGDVVAAVENSGMAWRLGKMATRAWQAAGAMRWRWRWHWRAARGRWRPGQLAGVKAAASVAHGENREAGGGR
jgi:hypothetical protein